MGDEKDFLENDTTQTQDTPEENVQNQQTASDTSQSQQQEQGQQNSQDQYQQSSQDQYQWKQQEQWKQQQEYNQYQQQGYNQYQQQGYNQYQQYQQNYNQYQQTQRGPHGKKLGQGFGIASLVLGIISLVFFCSCMNIPLAIIAIVLGIIQLVGYEKKGLAIGGISTAGASILMFIICIAMLFSNTSFTDMVENEMGNPGQTPYDIEQFIERYEQGNDDFDIDEDENNDMTDGDIDHDESHNDEDTL